MISHPDSALQSPDQSSKSSRGYNNHLNQGKELVVWQPYRIPVETATAARSVIAKTALASRSGAAWSIKLPSAMSVAFLGGPSGAGACVKIGRKSPVA